MEDHVTPDTLTAMKERIRCVEKFLQSRLDIVRSARVPSSSYPTYVWTVWPTAAPPPPPRLVRRRSSDSWRSDRWE